MLVSCRATAASRAFVGGRIVVAQGETPESKIRIPMSAFVLYWAWLKTAKVIRADSDRGWMMTYQTPAISAGSTSSFPLDPSGFSQESRDFKALQNAIQAGNLPSAKSAFAAFQLDVQNISPTSGGGNPFNQKGPLAKDLQTVGSALQAGNVVNAQKAFATLSKDLKTAAQPAGNQPVGHAHHPKKDTVNSPSGILLNLRG